MGFAVNARTHKSCGHLFNEEGKDAADCAELKLGRRADRDNMFAHGEPRV